ncbi:hypothetical protein D3C85_1171800 [compost metagenome]
MTPVPACVHNCPEPMQQHAPFLPRASIPGPGNNRKKASQAPPNRRNWPAPKRKSNCCSLFWAITPGYKKHLHYFCKIGSLTKVSTKLKVNFGRYSPPARFLFNVETLLKQRTGLLDGFQVIPPRSQKTVSRHPYSDRTNLQIDQDLHPAA